MNQYISLILTTVAIFTSVVSNANSNASERCAAPLTKVTTELLQIEGFTKINTCHGAGSSENCQLENYGCYATDSLSPITCSLRYSYGGGYYNYNDYFYVVDSTCQIQSLTIERL